MRCVEEQRDKLRIMCKRITNGFKIKIGVHHISALNHFLSVTSLLKSLKEITCNAQNLVLCL